MKIIIGKIKKAIKQIFRNHFLKKEIKNYRKNLGPGEKFKIVFGGHWSNHQGWLILNKEYQDITKPLLFPNESVDVIFTEHVIEHISFLDCISFMRESKRILKPGGVFRVVSPMLEKLLSTSLSLENDKDILFIQNRLLNFYQKENKTLEILNLNGLSEYWKTFFLNNLFRDHGHEFIWSAELMVNVLGSLGYNDVQVCEVGDGSNKNYCIERRCRGLYLENNWKEDRSLGFVYDVESMVVEARK